MRKSVTCCQSPWQHIHMLPFKWITLHQRRPCFPWSQPFGILLTLNVLSYFITNIFNIILYLTLKNPIKLWELPVYIVSNLIQAKVKIPAQHLQKLFNMHYFKKCCLLVALKFVSFFPLWRFKVIYSISNFLWFGLTLYIYFSINIKNKKLWIPLG